MPRDTADPKLSHKTIAAQFETSACVEAFLDLIQQWDVGKITSSELVGKIVSILIDDDVRQNALNEKALEDLEAFEVKNA
jgi:hypothetical protein